MTNLISSNFELKQSHINLMLIFLTVLIDKSKKITMT